MASRSVDVAVIGAGTAGLAAWRAASAEGKRALLIEQGPGGTTCARVGCMPSKLLIAAAEAAHGVERWNEFGLRLEGSLRVDGQAVMARVRHERDRFVGFVLESVERIPDAARLRGKARFVGPQVLEIEGGGRIDFGAAVIATGSSPSVPPMLRGAEDRLLINDDIVEWQDLARSVAVFGPGVIGLELGQALARLGVRVRMFGVGGGVGPFTDRALRDYAAKSFIAELHLDADATVTALRRTDAGVEIRFRGGDGEITETFDYVLAATGRAANVRGLGLEHTYLALDARGVPLFDRNTMQCGASRIFIAGDANNDLPLLHEAADEGRIAGENAARFPLVLPASRRTPLAIVFTDPQLAVVGKRHAELPAGRWVAGEVSFEDQGRSRVMLRNKGLARIYAETGSGRVLGAEMMGPDAEHLAHLLAWGIESGMSVQRMLQMPFYHPVVEEGLRTALRDAQEKLGAAGAERKAA
jgi:dihydrolipoamide dehydrogenase